MEYKYINPVTEACQQILKSIAKLETNIGNIHNKKTSYDGSSIVIMIGLTGDVKGQVIINLNENIACSIASGMIGMQINTFDEMTKSAVGECANIILGNAATKFYNEGVSVDITPPTVLTGKDIRISAANMETVCVPLVINDGETIEVDIILETI